MAEELHGGHRARMKERFLKEGLDHFDRHQIVEMLLFFGIPRKDTNATAHRLIETFGGLPGVLEAPYEELCRVEGVTANAAVLISFCGQMFQMCIRDRGCWTGCRTGKRPAVLCAGGRSSKTGIPPICFLSVWTPCR